MAEGFLRAGCANGPLVSSSGFVVGMRGGEIWVVGLFGLPFPLRVPTRIPVCSYLFLGCFPCRCCRCSELKLFLTGHSPFCPLPGPRCDSERCAFRKLSLSNRVNEEAKTFSHTNSRQQLVGTRGLQSNIANRRHGSLFAPGHAQNYMRDLLHRVSLDDALTAPLDM